MFGASLINTFNLIDNDEVRAKILNKMERKNICPSLINSIEKDKFLDDAFCTLLKNIAVQFHFHEIGYIKFDCEDSILCNEINKKIRFSKSEIDDYFFEKSFSNCISNKKKVKFLYEIILFLCSEEVSNTIINYLEIENKNALLREDIINSIRKNVLYIKESLKGKVFEKNNFSKEVNVELLFLKLVQYFIDSNDNVFENMNEEKYKSLILKKSYISILEQAFNKLYGPEKDNNENNSQLHI